MSGFYLYAQAQDATRTPTMTVTVNSAYALSDPGNISFTITPGVANAQSVAFDVTSNDPDGHNVTFLAEDLDANPGQLCVNDGSGACLTGPGNTFATDDGTDSYVRVTSITDTDGGYTATSIADATEGSDLTTTPSTIVDTLTNDDLVNQNTLTIVLTGFASTAVPAKAYTGTLTIDLTGKP